MKSLVALCRAGFEGECVSELQEIAARYDVSGFGRAKKDSGWVAFEAHGGQAFPPEFFTRLQLRDLVFAREVFFALEPVNGLPENDRVSPLVELCETALAPLCPSKRLAGVFVEAADTNDGRALLPFCGSFAKPLQATLKKQGWLLEPATAPKVSSSAGARGAGVEPGRTPPRASAATSEVPSGPAPRLHVLFLNYAQALIGLSWPGQTLPAWPMGVPRLKFPADAPSRSTLKLEEALLTFIPPSRREALLHAGQRAVDLGAAPGGWTYQLVRRGLHVTAIDNGPLAESLLATGLVEHLRVDGFKYLPKNPVDWLVCDMVEQPGRIARLVSTWLTAGHARNAIFNLKLPMKKRAEEVKTCLAAIRTELQATGKTYILRCRQLYHDREEVTVYVSLDCGADT